jgi:hypothetical protein
LANRSIQGLKITWSRGIYLSEDDSPCQFSMWHLEVSSHPPAVLPDFSGVFLGAVKTKIW